MKGKSDLKNIIDKISYKSKYQKELEQYKVKYETYLDMPDAEFIMKYTKVMAKHNGNKVAFNVSWLTTLVALAFILYRYVATIKNELTHMSLSMLEEDVIVNVSIVVVAIIFMSAALIFMAAAKSRYDITREKIFIEEIKELRVERGNS